MHPSLTALLTARLSVVESAKNTAAKIASLGIVLSEIFAPTLNSGSVVPFPLYAGRFHQRT
jgi:hypothetical protein